MSNTENSKSGTAAESSNTFQGSSSSTRTNSIKSGTTSSAQTPEASSIDKTSMERPAESSLNFLRFGIKTSQSFPNSTSSKKNSVEAGSSMPEPMDTREIDEPSDSEDDYEESEYDSEEEARAKAKMDAWDDSLISSRLHDYNAQCAPGQMLMEHPDGGVMPWR